ncbi:MAG: hypothetical protein AAGA11_20065 [Pseudomonadota bacterium]
MSKHIVTKAVIDNMDGQSRSCVLNPNAQRVNESLGELASITGYGFHIKGVMPW